MSPIVLVAMPADHDRVRNIVGALSESDLDVYWERTAPGSRQWKKAADRVLEARAVLFFWSAAAQADAARPFRALARRALAAGKAICVQLDGGALPGELSGCTIYDLRGWRGRASSLFMLDLVAAAKAKAAGLDPPLPRAPRQLLFRRLAYAVPTAIAAIAIMVGLYRDFGIDRIAGSAETARWAAMRPGSCEDLRRFLGEHSNGVHAAEAQALLNARAVSSNIRWRPTERLLPIFVSIGDEAGAPDEPGARRAALARGQPEAQRNCRRLAEAASARFRSARLRADRFECERFQTGMVCAFQGEAVCALDESYQVAVETCGHRR